jgi:DNA repair protein RadC
VIEGRGEAKRSGCLRVRDLPLDDRPREKLLRLGPANLTDAELLALILRTGMGGGSALDLARDLLRRYGSLGGVARVMPAELLRIKGLGPAKVAGLSAALELSRRRASESEIATPLLTGPEDVARHLVPRLRDLPWEVFILVILDSRNALRKQIELSRGSLNASIVHPREVFKAAIDERAAGIIVAHNHPSGNAEPSREDLDLTRQLVESGKILGIPLHDHIIVAGDRFTSLAERGVL